MVEEQVIPCERAGLTGAVFLDATNALSTAAREEAIFDAMVTGSVPSFGHLFAEVRLDYSHGVRWIHGTMVVDGVERLVADVLRDPELAPLVSDEGPLSSVRAAWPFH